MLIFNYTCAPLPGSGLYGFQNKESNPGDTGHKKG
jgi:hypothetical protein